MALPAWRQERVLQAAAPLRRVAAVVRGRRIRAGGGAHRTDSKNTHSSSCSVNGAHVLASLRYRLRAWITSQRGLSTPLSPAPRRRFSGRRFSGR